MGLCRRETLSRNMVPVVDDAADCIWDSFLNLKILFQQLLESRQLDYTRSKVFCQTGSHGLGGTEGLVFDVGLLEEGSKSDSEEIIRDHHPRAEISRVTTW